MTNHHNLPSCDDILNLPTDAMPQLVRDLSARRQLNLMIRTLNADMLGGETKTRSRARAVLARLGFVEG